MSIIVVLLSSDCTVPLLMFAVMTLAVKYAAGVSFKLYFRLLMIPAIFIIISIITIIVKINAPETGNIFTVSILSVTAGADMMSLKTGGQLFLKSFASVSCFYFLILSTPVADFEYILKTLRFPLFFREMFMMVYRFIFIVTGMSTTIYISQKARLGYTTLNRSFKSFGALASGVFINSLVFGKKSYNALLARGYDGELKIIDMRYKISPVNCLVILAVELCFAALLIGKNI
jgi:cobalt/nickel transport system permease protein